MTETSTEGQQQPQGGQQQTGQQSTNAVTTNGAVWFPPTQQQPQSGQQQQGGQQGQQPAQQSGQQQGQQQPPWERNGEQFDPERAWNLIQSLRDDKATLQSKVGEFEQQNMTEAQKLTQRAETAERQVTDANAQLARLQVALEHGFVTQGEDGRFALDTRAVDLLGTGTPEELAARAKQIAELRGGAQQQQRQEPFSHGAHSAAPASDMNSLILGQLGGRRT
jgi:hypothetical protein